MYTISKDFHISCSHQLHGLPEGHKCSRVHGHNVIVRVELSSEELDRVGFIVDYGDLAPLGRWLDVTFDHRHLNDVVPLNPTAELLAQHVFEWCVQQGWPVSGVGWSETPNSWAWWRA